MEKEIKYTPDIEGEYDSFRTRIERRVRQSKTTGKEEHYETIIKKYFTFAGEGFCRMTPPDENKDKWTAEFELNIPAVDHIEEARIKMSGPVEREEMIEFLETIVNEMKLMQLE